MEDKSKSLEYGDDPFGILKKFRSYQPLLKPAPKRRRRESDDEFVPVVDSSDNNSDYEVDLNRPGPSRAKTKAEKKVGLLKGKEKNTSKVKPATKMIAKTSKSPSTKKPIARPRPRKTGKVTEVDDVDDIVNIDWDIAEYIAETENVNNRVASNIIQLLKEDNTIPFIARYRTELTGGMDAQRLREVKESFETLESVQHKAVAVTKSIKALGKLTPILEKSICYSRSISELDHIVSVLCVIQIQYLG